MHLSIIIVNYNVKYFLEQCLRSVEKAITHIDAQVFVVDNNSSDDSIAYLKPKFPFVKYVANTENVGFAKANNLVLNECLGDYILYLNPDTIIPEDCLEKCIAFFESHDDCGALGIKMIDGSGTFLPESKRGFPSPVASFFKLTGLSDIFPKSKLFNQYSLGYLSEFENHKVDVLAGAFMMVKKEILLTTKGFDEAFFMYGEDIDLSYRIQQLGFNNYYFADSTILHFKGESTKKGSLNYVKMFYSAMNIFVKKHYSGNKARVFTLFIQGAIFFRALVSLLKSLIISIGLPLLDAVIIYFSFWETKNEWIRWMRDGQGFAIDNFPLTFLSFTIIFLISGALSGMYDNPEKPSKTFASSIAGVIVMMAVYGVLPERFWFSRAVMILGGSSAGIAITVFRLILFKLKFLEPSDEEYKFQQTAVVGSNSEYEAVQQIFNQAGLEERLLGRIKINGESENAVGDIKNLKEFLVRLNIREVVFCEGALTNHLNIQLVQTLPRNISYRFIGSNTKSIVGSDSKATAGETLAAEGFYRINEAYNKRMKRVVDITFSLYLLATFPVQLFFVRKKSTLILNVINVLINQATWVGYGKDEISLPTIKKGVLTCYGFPKTITPSLNDEAMHHLNIQSAKNYDFWMDVKIVLKNYNYLGG
jgi:GT2 family glycosyltransferase